MQRNYLSSVNNNLKNLSGSNQKLATQRAFNQASENVSAADRALRVRKLIADNEEAVTTIQDLDARYAAAENSIRAINDIMGTVIDDSIRGMNGTMDAQDREKLAREVENLQEHVLQTMNAKFSDRPIFAASGGPNGGNPFVVDDATGELTYNGQPVDKMVADTSGKPTLGGVPIDYNGRNYIDVGLGFTVNGDGTTGVLDKRTAVPGTFSGVDTFGFGLDDKGNPKNIYSLLGKLADDLRSGDPDTLSVDLDAVKLAQSNLLVQLTDVGNLSKFINQTGERLSADTLNLQEVQNRLEAVPLEKEIMYNKEFEMSWMVTLQLGGKILPPSVFDFLR